MKVVKFVASLFAFAFACIGYIVGFVWYSLFVGFIAGGDAVNKLSSH